MPSDIGFTPSYPRLRETVATVVKRAERAGRLPGFDWARPHAHWAIRIPLAGLLLTYGAQKFPDAFLAPGEYGVPAVLFVLAAFAEVLGAMFIVFGGVIESWRPAARRTRLVGDLFTRAGGFAGVAAVSGVIVYFYWGAVTIASLQVMALGLAAFFLLRGNPYSRTGKAAA